MARVHIDLPETFVYSTELAVRITDINYGGHLGNDSLISLLHEARARFLQHHGFSEMAVGGAGIIVADAAVVYRAEAFFGDRLQVAIGGQDFSRIGADLVYRVTAADSDREVALAKTGIVFFDYGQRKVRAAPPEFRALFRA